MKHFAALLLIITGASAAFGVTVTAPLGGGSSESPIVLKHNGTVTVYTGADAAARGAQLLVAKTAAVSGDVIEVTADCEVDGASLLKNGVNWYFAPGVTITEASDTFELLGDGGSAITCTVSGGGKFVQGVVDPILGSANLVHTSNASSDVTVNAESFNYTGSDTIECAATWCEAGTMHVHCTKDMTVIGNNSVYAVWWTNGDMHVECDTLNAPNYVAVLSDVNDTPTGDLYVKADKIHAPTAVFNRGSDTTAAAWINAQVIDTKPYSQTGSNRIYINADKIFGAVNAASGSGLCYITAQKHSANANGSAGVGNLLKWNAGTLHYQVGHIDPGSYTGETLLVGGGTAYISGTDFTGGASAKGIAVSGGTVEIKGLKADTSANSSTNAVSISAGTVTLSDNRFTSHASAKDVAQTGGTVTVVGGRGTGTGGGYTTSGTVGLTGTGTGQPVFNTSPTLATPILGTPTSGTLTNCTGLPATSVTGLGTGIATWWATPTSANLAAALTNETGSGAAVFGTSPTLTTPNIGVATGTSLTLGSAGTLSSEAANSLSIIGGTTIQQLNVYRTYTDASNYRRVEVAGNAIQFAAAGTGVVSADFFVYNNVVNSTAGLSLGTQGGERWRITGTGHFLAGADNSYDIGATGATRPRTIYVGTSIAVGSSPTAVTRTLSNTATLDFGSTNAQTSSELTITVTGAAVGDAVFVGPPAAPNANTCYTAHVSSANTVTVRFNNYSSGSIDPASATFRVAVIQF